MTNQAYEILCPTCRTPLPADTARCPNCSGRTAQSAGSAAPSAPASSIESDEISNLRLKDYHELVRVTHMGNEGPRATGLNSPLVPALLLLLLGVGVGLAILLGWF